VSGLMVGDLVTVRSTARGVHPRWRTELLEVFDVSGSVVRVRATGHVGRGLVGSFEVDELERVVTVLTNNGRVRVGEWS
jgi:hypothetical protein